MTSQSQPCGDGAQPILPPVSEPTAARETLLIQLWAMRTSLEGDVEFARRCHNQDGTAFTEDSFVIPRHWMPHCVAKSWIETFAAAEAAIAKAFGPSARDTTERSVLAREDGQ